MHKLKNNSIWRNFQLNVDNNARLLWVNFMTLCDWSKKRKHTTSTNQISQNKQTNKQTKTKKTGNGHSRFSRA